VALVSNLLTANDANFDSTVGTWVAGSNTSVARTTAHFQGSPASLRLTSAAAGALSAFSGKYAVSPSTEYEAYCYAGNAVATAGRIVSIKIDWYTSGDVYISSSTTTTPETLPNSTAFAGPIVVVGTSPSNAAKASLQVNVTAGITAGSQAVDIDTLGLGLPVQDTGNLIPYNTASAEMDTSGWSVSNGTLARSTGSAEGAYCLRATSTASGDMTVTSAARFPVTTGVAYELYPWVFAPAAGRSLILEIRWYDAAVAGTLLSTSSRTATTFQSVAWERHTVLGTAPATATHAEVRLRPQTTGAAEVWYFDRVTLRTQPLLAGNLLSYAAQSLEVGIADWTAAGNCTLALSAPQESSAAGGYSLKATCTASGQARIEAAATVAVTEGLYYNASVRFRTVGASPASICWLDIDWYDASMVYLGSASPDQDSTITGDVYNSDTIGRLAPPGAAFAKVILLPQATVASQVFFLDEISFASGTPPYVVEAHPETGSVTITLNSLAGVAVLDLYRVDPDGTLAPVRGFGSDVEAYAVTGSTMLFQDYEVPLGVAVRYQFTKDAGATTRTYAVAVDPPDDEAYVWFTDPGQPARNLLLAVSQAPDWQQAVERGVYRVRGAARPVVISDVRGDDEGDLSAATYTESEARALKYLLAEGSVLLIRARPGWDLDKVYVSVGNTSRNRVSQYGPEWARRWTLPLTVVDRPVGGMAGSAGRTWQDVLDDPETPTWGDLPAKYPTWLDVLQGVD